MTRTGSSSPARGEAVVAEGTSLLGTAGLRACPEGGWKRKPAQPPPQQPSECDASYRDEEGRKEQGWKGQEALSVRFPA